MRCEQAKTQRCVLCCEKRMFRNKNMKNGTKLIMRYTNKTEYASTNSYAYDRIWLKSLESSKGVSFCGYKHICRHRNDVGSSCSLSHSYGVFIVFAAANGQKKKYFRFSSSMLVSCSLNRSSFNTITVRLACMQFEQIRNHFWRLKVWIT